MKAHRPITLSALTLTILFVAACDKMIAEEAGPPDRPPLKPEFTAITAPDEFGVGDPNGFMLLVFVDGQDLDPLLETPVLFNITASSGQPIDAPPSNAVTIGDVALGGGVVGFDFSDIEAKGDITVCAAAEGVAGKPCTTVALFDAEIEALSDLVQTEIRNRDTLRRLLRRRFPNIGCRCTGKEVKIDRTKRPDGNLGSFSNNLGGNRLGPHRAGNVRSTPRFTSTMKFEAHFTYAIINEPQQGAIPDGAWQGIQQGMVALCSEGQNINSTITFNAGTQNQVAKNKKKDGTDYPYDTSKDASKLTTDGWGYVVQARSSNREITGRLKSYEAPDIVHWIDAPGLNNRPTRALKGLEPFHMDAFFHVFLHGSPSVPANNCDCYFGLRTGRADARGVAQSPRILSNVDCGQ
ncbi:MAG: hypothetical protein GY791_16875 [Alphaproteobacteria bacterium]|nr:hypothetical protein [Alphaproteobacteria bacterium]